MASRRDTLRVQNFAQVRDAEIQFGDLTVLVGPQGSGKSLVLQLLKLALDGDEIASALVDAGHSVSERQEFLDVYFGQGMSGAWTDNTRVTYEGRPVSSSGKGRRTHGKPGRLFYIPAHRALLLAEGWPAPFLKLAADTPTIARLFSQNLFTLFANPRDTELFPVARRLKEEYRNAIDDAVFHGGRVSLGKEGLRKRLELRYEGTSLPFMTWTAGQREFTPLLLGLYHLLPARKLTKQPDIDWVVIEEPEMGLHPRAIAVVMLLVLDLLWRGYRVVISTHAPLVLDVLFMLRTLREHGADPKLLCDAFRVECTPGIRPVMKAALEKDYRTFYLRFAADGRVESRDISELDPFSASEDEADWGGLTQLSSSFNSVIAQAVNG